MSSLAALSSKARSARSRPSSDGHSFVVTKTSERSTSDARIAAPTSRSLP